MAAGKCLLARCTKKKAPDSLSGAFYIIELISVLFGVTHRTGFANYRDFDLSGIGHFVLNTF